MTPTTKNRVLFVCLGNICRSPMAETIFSKIVSDNGVADNFEIDSAGLYGGHAGELPDPRMRVTASKRGYQMTSRARQVRYDDFFDFDIILGMDDDNIDSLRRMAPDIECRDKVHRMTEFCRTHTADYVPDPYYGGQSGFDYVIDLLEDACEGLFETLNRK